MGFGGILDGVFFSIDRHRNFTRNARVQEPFWEEVIEVRLVPRGGDGREGEDGEQAVLGGGVRGGRRAGRLQHLPRRLLRQQPLHGLLKLSFGCL